MKRSNSNDQLTLATITAAAGFCRVPVAVLRQCKKAGAAGFRPNGNVHLPDLLKWLLTRGKNFTPKLDLETARAELAQARAEQITREADKQAGRLVPPDDVLRVLNMALYWWRISLPEVAAKLAFAIAPKDPWPLSDAIKTTLQTAHANTLAAVLSSDQAGLPAWAVEAIREGVESESPEKFDARAEAFKELFAHATAAVFRDSLKSELAKREAEQRS